MSDFLWKFAQSMMSEAGIVAVMLAIAVFWQTKELKLERDDNKKLNDKILELATGQISAMNELQNVLKTVMDFLKRDE